MRFPTVIGKLGDGPAISGTSGRAVVSAIDRKPLATPSLEATPLQLESKIAALCDSAAVGDIANVMRLLNEDPSLVERPVSPYNQRRAIHYAAREGHVEVVETLLAYGADPLQGVWPYPESSTAYALAEARGQHGVTSVIEAWLKRRYAEASKGEWIAELIRDGEFGKVTAELNKDGSIVHARDRNAETPLFHAVRSGALELVRDLLQRGAEPDARNDVGRRPIHLALAGSSRPFGRAPVSSQSLVLGGVLLGHGAQYDLWVASALGDVPAIQRLALDEPHHVNSSRSYGASPEPIGFPLTVASLHGHLEAVRALLNCGADPDAGIDHVWSGGDVELGGPLLYASAAGHLEVVRLLLQRGAEPNTKLQPDPGAPFSRTPVSEALNRRDSDLLDLLYRYGAVGHVEAYAMAGRIDVVAEVLATNPDAAATVARVALASGSPDLLRAALQRKPKMPTEEWTRSVWLTFTSWAGRDDRRDYVGVLEVLLAHGLSPESTDWEGITLLHRLAQAEDLYPADRVQFARLLVDHGAKANARDEEFCSTPLAWAARFGRRELVDFYLKRRVPARLPDDPAWATPLAWAQRMGHQDVARTLERAESQGQST